MSYDRAAVHAVLDEALVSHVGFVVDGQSVVLPQLHARVEDTLSVHGSTGARGLRSGCPRWLGRVCDGDAADGLVFARSAFHHSNSYRAVVAHGTAFLVTEAAEKTGALRTVVEAVAPGRAEATRGPTVKELAATAVLRLDLVEVSLKARTGGPNEEADDQDLPYWAGALPLSSSPGQPEPAPDLSASIEVPDHVREWARPVGG